VPKGQVFNYADDDLSGCLKTLWVIISQTCISYVKG